MQFIDLKSQQERIRSGLEARIKAILDHGRYILGPEVAEVEERLKEYCGAANCISCSSGTDALLMLLMGLDVGPGDIVFVPDFTFIATAEMVALLGATPCFVDIQEDTYNICPKDLERKIGIASDLYPEKRPKGIITVDLFGQPVDYEEIEVVARKFELWVIDDAAQGYGAAYKDKRVGALTPYTATSFFPAKPLGCYGDGGAVFCQDDGFAEKLKSIRVHGQGSDRYENVRLGINGRFDSIQAAVLLEKLTIFDDELERRNEAASFYSEALKNKYAVPVVKPDRSSVWAQYALRHPERDKIMEGLKERGIPAAIYYPIPIHEQKGYEQYSEGIECTVTERVSKEVFSIPMHPYLTPEVQQEIVDALVDVG